MVVDGTQLYQDAIKRIRQLEKLNATLAAEIDRMRPVIGAASKLTKYSLVNTCNSAYAGELAVLEGVVTKYEAGRG